MKINLKLMILLEAFIPQKMVEYYNYISKYYLKFNLLLEIIKKLYLYVNNT